MESKPENNYRSNLTESQSAYIDSVFEDNPELASLFENAKVFFDHNKNEISVNKQTGMIESNGHSYIDSPHMRSLVLRASAIRNSVPPVSAGYMRLWRGNREGEIGKNPSFTSALEGIALPFLSSYGGSLSYVDIPLGEYNAYVQTGVVAPDTEFRLPPEVAATAIEVKEPREENLREKAKELFQKYLNQGGKIDIRQALQWVSTTS